MLAPKTLACAIAIALFGVANFAAAAPQQVDQTQNAYAPVALPQNGNPQNANPQDAMPVLPQTPPQQTATPPDQGQDQEVEPIGPPPPPKENPPENVPLIDYTLELGVQHSSNITLSSNNPISQTLLIPRATFVYDQTGTTVQAHVVGEAEYIDYLEGDFDNQVRGELAGSLNWDILPQRLALSVLDTSSLQPVDFLASNAPNNLQQVNVLSLGPVLSLGLGGKLHGQAELRYINTVASKSKGFDSNRGLGALSLIDDLNATDQLSGNLEAEHVRLQHPTFAPTAIGKGYDHYDAYARYVSKLAHMNIDVSLGGTRYTFNSSLPDQSSVLARARVDWELSGHSSLGFGGARELTDAAEDLLQNQNQLNEIVGLGIGDLGVGNNAITPDVFRQTRLDAEYSWAGPRLSYSAGPYYRRVQYVADTLLNRNDFGATVHAGWRLTPQMTLGFDAGLQRTRYTSTLNRRDTSYGLGPNLTDQFAPHWRWRAELTHTHRNSNQAGSRFNDNVAFFALVYQR